MEIYARPFSVAGDLSKFDLANPDDQGEVFSMDVKEIQRDRVGCNLRARCLTRNERVAAPPSHLEDLDPSGFLIARHEASFRTPSFRGTCSRRSLSSPP